MKNLITLITLIVSLNAISQVTLENSYSDNSSGYFFNLVKFSNLSEKYVFADSVNIRLYNLNHSLYKTIAFPEPNREPVLYNISDNLFDLDNDLEIMITWYEYAGGERYHTRVYNEDGSLILQADSAKPVSYYFTDIETFRNTSSGTKMFLYKEGTYYRYGNETYGVIGTDVYNLPGSYISSLKHNTEDTYYSGMLSNPNPNPSQNSTLVKYELPDGVANGEIVIYNMDGKEQKRYQVDRTFKELVLDNTDLPSGNYLYNLSTSVGSSSAKKMMVIR